MSPAVCLNKENGIVWGFLTKLVEGRKESVPDDLLPLFILKNIGNIEISKYCNYCDTLITWYQKQYLPIK